MRAGLPDAVARYGIVYALVVCAMLASSIRVSPYARTGAIFFVLSNQLLVLTFIYPSSIALHCMELLLFYIAVILLSMEYTKKAQDA